MFNVRDYGAVGDGVADDRTAIQAALDAGAGNEVFVPNGTYCLTHRPGFYWCISIPANTTLRGESRDGAVLLLAPAINMSMNLVECGAPDIVIRDVTLDGNKINQVVNPHQAGIFAVSAPRLQMRRVTARNFRGDGFYIYAGSDDVSMYDCLATLNDRNGLTLGGATTGGTFAHSYFTSNGAEQFDSESDGVNGRAINNVTITDCTFDAQGLSQDYVLTLTGTSATERSSGWTVTRNTINGPVAMVWITDVTFVGNTCTNATGKPGLFIYRTCDRILVNRNTFHNTGPALFDAGSVVYVSGTNPGQAPGGVTICHNTLATSQLSAGITVMCVRDIDIHDNDVSGVVGGTNGSMGVFVRTTRVEEPVRFVSIQRNTFSGFNGASVMLGGNGLARINRVIVSDNVFDGTSGMVLNTEDDAALDVTQYGNVQTNSNLPLVAKPPKGTMVTWGDGQRWTRTA